MKTHHKKIEGLKRTQNKINNIRNCPTENIIHNSSSYALSEEEKCALSFSLDENIAMKLNENKIQTEFKSLYWQLLQDTKLLSQQEQDQLKSKIRRTCANYARIKKTDKYKKIKKNLSHNKDIIILKQDEGRGLVILNSKSYIENAVKSLKQDNLDNLKYIQRKQSKENYKECFEVLRTCLLKENRNNYIQLAQNSAHSMEMLKYIN